MRRAAAGQRGSRSGMAARGPLVFVVVAATSLGCQLVGPRYPAAHPWREVRSAHFVTQTDLDEDDALAAAKALERENAMLARVAFPGYGGSLDAIDVVVLRDEDELRTFAPDKVGGWFTDQPSPAIERSPMLVTYGSLERPAARRILLHELTHRYLNRLLGYVPTWLGEGLADYDSTLRVDDGFVWYGEILPDRIIPSSEVPSVRALIGAGREKFHGADAERYYAGAWALVHFFQNGAPAWTTRYDAFLRALGAGMRVVPAWAEAMEGVDPDALERDFHAYLDARAWTRFRAPVTLPPAPPVTGVRVMRDAEVHLRLARLAIGVEPSTAMHAEVDAARRAEPTSAEVAYWTGCLALRDGKPADAEIAFRAALEREPHEGRYALGVVRSLRRQDVSERAPDVRLALERLATIATTPDQLDEVSTWLAVRGDPAGALARARASVTMDPGYWRSLATLAQALAVSGDATAAVDAQERAIAHLPERVVDPASAEALARYREAARNAPAR